MLLLGPHIVPMVGRFGWCVVGSRAVGLLTVDVVVALCCTTLLVGVSAAAVSAANQTHVEFE